MSVEFTAFVDQLVSLTQCLAVVSDMRLDQCKIWYGEFARHLGLDGHNGETYPSIWEKKIYDRISPDDLTAKHLRKLKYLDFVKRKKPESRRFYALVNQLRMTTGNGHYIQVKHTMRYVDDAEGMIVAALCTYEPLIGSLPSPAVAVDLRTGEIVDLNETGESILSPRETEVLRLIGEGFDSFQIAGMMGISKNTVSRHRQNIISRLQVKNTTEAYRLAQQLGLI